MQDEQRQEKEYSTQKTYSRFDSKVAFVTVKTHFESLWTVYWKCHLNT